MKVAQAIYLFGSCYSLATKRGQRQKNFSVEDDGPKALVSVMGSGFGDARRSGMARRRLDKKLF
jgi:hypothetical protein